MIKDKYVVLKSIYDYSSVLLVDDYETHKLSYDYLMNNGYVDYLWNNQTEAYHVQINAKGIEFLQKGNKMWMTKNG
jgi:hypothetical protein